MPPLRRRLFVCVVAAGLWSAGAAARARALPAPQRSPTAHCSDGTYYYGPRSRKACEHHRGVAEWLAAANRPRASSHAKPAARGRAAAVPRGATARCGDGSYSLVRNRAKACAGHKGIARWLRAR